MQVNQDGLVEFRNDLERVSFEFALKARVICKDLAHRRVYHIADQFSRSSSSIAANINESSFCASRKDFINKLRIATKEVSESIFWIHLLDQSGEISESQDLLLLIRRIHMMLNKAIATAVKNEKARRSVDQ
jgi:four helix bundle protein